MTEPTPYQRLAQVREQYGCVPRLMPYDEIISIGLFDDHAVIVLAHYKVEERSTEDVLSGRTLQMWKCSTELPFASLEVTVPDDTFVSTRHTRWGYKTTEERRAKSMWEAQCGSPGHSRFGAPIQAERERDYFGSGS